MIQGGVPKFRVDSWRWVRGGGYGVGLGAGRSGRRGPLDRRVTLATVVQ
jgi:hypothetical protein